MWARGYFAVTVGNVNSTDVQKYIVEHSLDSCCCCCLKLVAYRFSAGL
ncbi:hypothetical protein [Candidatus Mesenet endosymbiont of Agriotes lineatus]